MSKGKVFIKMEEVILTLSRTEFYKKLEDFWTEILNKHITGGTGHFYASIEFSYGRATFIIDKNSMLLIQPVRFVLTNSGTCLNGMADIPIMKQSLMYSLGAI